MADVQVFLNGRSKFVDQPNTITKHPITFL